MSDAQPSLFTGAEWNYDTLRRTYDAIEGVAKGEFGLDTYANQVEVITAEQMLDAYASVGLPLLYKHWSYGKHFARDEALYRKGLQGLAYEIVINSNPCISYVMEENSMAMQTLVMAHAAFGHNHFFKANSLFRQWTDADGILDYMNFAKTYITRCEERHGHEAVERVLDAAHAIMDQSVHRYPRKRKLNLRQEEQRERERAAHQEQIYNDLWRTVPKSAAAAAAPDDMAERKKLLQLPEENLLYFIEKTAPKLETWQREILRIVRNLAQYFYPQKQTKVMNEGCATFVHYNMMHRLHETGGLSDGVMLEMLHAHTSVIAQPDFDDKRFTSLNPYALGFGMMGDIARIATAPTEEDRAWFPAFAGNGDPWGTLRGVWADYRDESFVLQFLSPHLMRKMKLFAIRNDPNDSEIVVTAIHDEHGYRDVRKTLAQCYDIATIEPDIQVVDVDLAGDRRLILHHRVLEGATIEADDARRVLQHIANIWGYPVLLVEVDSATDSILREHEPVEPAQSLS